MNKKGIAPLFATIILVTIAVALGIVVMNFGRAQIEISARCAIDIGLKPVVLKGEEQICLDSESNAIKLLLENGPVIPIQGLRARIIGDKDIASYDIPDSEIQIDSVFATSLDYDYSKFGEIKQLKITPTINLYNEEIICPERAVVLEQVSGC